MDLHGRGLRDLERIFDALAAQDPASVDCRQRLGLMGSHGLEWRFPISSWSERFRSLRFSPAFQEDSEREIQLRVSADWWAWRQERESRLPIFLKEHGLWLEDKQVSWTFHALPGTVSSLSSPSAHPPSGFEESTRRALESLEDSRVSLLYGKKVANFVERGHSKGRIVQELLLDPILNPVQGIERFTVLGDEETDETVFRLVRQDARICGIKVGEGETTAQYRVRSIAEVWEYLISSARDLRLSGRCSKED